MIFTQENEYSVVLDACVLVPMALCDLLLRLAEEPATYRPLWSEEIFREIAKALKTKLRRTDAEITWRLEQMRQAFPEAMVTIPSELLATGECLPDKDDRHVLAAAVMAQANAIVTQNTKHFPEKCLAKYGVICQTADDFLMNQYDLCPQLVLDKLDDQAAGIGHTRSLTVANLKSAAPKFCKRLEIHMR